jgi:hypothetical protein
MDDQDNIQSLKTLHAAFIGGDIHSVLGLFFHDLDFQHPMPQSIWPLGRQAPEENGISRVHRGPKSAHRV